MADKKESTQNCNITGTSGLSGKSVTAVHAWMVGAVQVIEIVTSTGSTFIKWKQGRCDVGGDATFGSGTVVL